MIISILIAMRSGARITVGTVTVYRLDGCGFEPWWGKRFSVLC
jgi:hypothetical protein